MTDRLTARWNQCRTRIQAGLSREDAFAWLPFVELESLSEEGAVLTGVPNSFFRNRIAQFFTTLIRDCLAEEFSEYRFSPGFRLELRIGELRDSTLDPAELPMPGRPPIAEAGEPTPPGPGGKYTFASLVEADGNRVAVQAARETIAAPGSKFNPLVVVGGEGAGKTHLLQAMAGELAARPAGGRVVSLTGEGFTNAVLEGIRLRRMGSVRELFRGADALLMDGVDFLGVSERAQQELLHTFDALLNGGKQMVFSSSRFPGQLARLDPALQARLQTGLTVELAEAGEEWRLNLLWKRAAIEGITLPEEAARLLAARIGAGSRQLEGALLRVAAYASLQNRPITVELAEEVAGPYFDRAEGPPELPLSSEKILARVADRFGLTLKTLRARLATQNVSRARRVAAFLLRELGGLSYAEIGTELGNRAYSTVYEALQAARAKMATDLSFRRTVMTLRQELAEEEELFSSRRSRVHLKNWPGR